MGDFQWVIEWVTPLQLLSQILAAQFNIGMLVVDEE